MLTDHDFELLQRHTDAENAHHLDDTLATLTEDCIFHDVALGGRRTGHAGAAAYYRTWWQGLDIFVDVEHVYAVAGEPMVVAETVWKGRHIGDFLGIAPTFRTVTIPVVIVARLRGGLLHEEHLYWDSRHLLDQITDHAPPLSGVGVARRYPLDQPR